ncbi:MAG: hypothetical protein JXA08_00495 [Methanomicrobiaceae archaeon]|nr:hypothetical protein [Methanomicrobiaceae archaeon]
MAPDGRIPAPTGSDDTTKYLRYLNRGLSLPYAEVAVKEDLLRDDLVMASVQPVGMRAFSDLSVAGSSYFAAQNKSGIHAAKIQMNIRNLDKAHLAADKIRYVEEDEPGVIPRTLDIVEDTLGRFHTECQPRIEAILDSVHGNLTGSEEAIGKLNSIFGAVTDFAGDHSLLVKIGLGVAACGFVATLVLIPLVLLRILLIGV